jgi:hypothetical protein
MACSIPIVANNFEIKKLSRYLRVKIQLPSARNGNSEAPVYFLETNQWHTVRKMEKYKWLCYMLISKNKTSPTTRIWRRRGERRYSSYSLMTSALDRGKWSGRRPGRALPPGKGPRYPLYRRLGMPQSRSGHRGYKKNPLASAGDRTSIARSSSP